MMPYLRRASPSPGRVVHVSSGGQYTTRLDVTNLQFEKNPGAFDGSLQYARVKRAQVVLAEMWAQRIPATEAVSNSMHPGWADTPGVRSSIPQFYESHKDTLRSPAQGIDTMVWLASSREPKAVTTNGKFVFDREPALTDFWLAGTAVNSAEKAALWDACERLCGRTFTADELTALP
jgi:dehydrogenase/reductase SDR family protein 12